MKSILRARYARPLAIYLAVALIALSTFAGPAEAMFVPAAPHQSAAAVPLTSGGRAADLARVQTALESRIVQQKLLDYGLSPTETMARVNMLSDQQLHELAAHTDSIQAGGDPVGAFFGAVIVALLIVLLIFLVQGRIQVK